MRPTLGHALSRVVVDTQSPVHLFMAIAGEIKAPVVAISTSRQWTFGRVEAQASTSSIRPTNSALHTLPSTLHPANGCKDTPCGSPRAHAALRWVGSGGPTGPNAERPGRPSCRRRCLHQRRASRTGPTAPVIPPIPERKLRFCPPGCSEAAMCLDAGGLVVAFFDLRPKPLPNSARIPVRSAKNGNPCRGWRWGTGQRAS
jgi:hypothetical protein